MLGTLTDTQVDDLLRSEVVGRIGCHVDGRTYVVPVTYVYHDGCIYGHSGEGQKLRMMRANPEVCFEVDQMDNMANWRSAIVQGHFEELPPEEAVQGMQLLVDRLQPLLTSETSRPSHGLDGGPGHQRDVAGAHAAVYRIRVESKTGRFEQR